MSRVQLSSRVLSVLLLVCGTSGAAPSLDELSRRLQNAEDFRVRTQAALALGASKDKRALTPLCRGLGDANTSVRAAAAAALGKLRLGGADCLKRRLRDETSAAVKATIEKALADAGAEVVEAEPTLTTETKFYVAIDKTADNTGREGKAVDDIVRGAMSKSASVLGGYVIAPKSETPAQAKKRLAKFKHVRAFLLSPRVEAPRYADGNLTVKVEVAIFTYPGRALKGAIPIKLTQQGVSGADQQSENELIQMAAERALEKFSQNVERID
jgi:hypothetical protein